MITIQVGKLFCEMYNEENGTNLSSRDIFRDVIAPLLFNGKEHLVIWHNSKFYQWRYAHNKTWNPNDFENKLDEFCEGIESEKGGLEDSLKVFGGCAVPYDEQLKYKNIPQKTLFAYAENQHFTIEERYYSWIGSAFLLNVNSGVKNFAIGVNNKEFVKIMYKSVKAYRKMLEENVDIQGKKLYTWNTLYFYNYLHYNDVTSIVEKYYNGDILKSDLGFEHILFVCSKYLPNVKFINLESFDKTNITCGTVLVDNIYVNRMSDVLEKLYKDVHDNEDFSKFSFNKEFGGKNLLLKAIETGSVYDGFFDPLSDINFDKKLKKNNLVIKYIELIMNDENKKLAQDFISEIHRIIKNGGKNKKNIHFEIPFSSNKFIDSITEVINVSGEKENPILNSMVEYILANSQNNEFKLMVSYLKYLFANK